MTHDINHDTSVNDTSVNDTSGTDISGTDTGNSTLASLAEERCWMLHQQDPLAASGPFVSVIQLHGNINITQLHSALEVLYSGDSNLNSVYELNDEGELHRKNKNLSDFCDSPIQTEPVTSSKAAINKMLDRQLKPIELAQEPVVQFIIMPKTDARLPNQDDEQYADVFLGILGHHILLDDSSWKPIFNSISQAYNGQPATAQEPSFALPKIPANQKAEDYWKNKFPNGLTKTTLPKVFTLNYTQPDAKPIDIHEFGKEKTSQHHLPVCRCYADISPTAVVNLSEKNNTSPFQTIVGLFGFYLATILDKDSVDILIPVVDFKQVNALNEIGSSSNVLPLRVAKNTLEQAITDSRNALMEGMMNSGVPIEKILSLTKTKRQAFPNVLATQFVDFTEFLTFPDASISKLSVPPIASDYDLTLAFQLTKTNIRLEITTGLGLSRSVGGLLLEHFVGFISQLEVQELSDELLQKAVNRLPSFGEQVVDKPEALANKHALGTENQNSHLTSTILQEFKEVLSSPSLLATDDFFDHGGHSLLATRVIGKLQMKHGIKVKIADFFNAPTANELSEYAQETETASQKGNTLPKSSDIIAPISLLQETYLEYAEYGKNPIFNIPYALRFTETVDEAAFQHAFTDVLERHHALRSIFIIREDDTVQKVIPMAQLAAYNWFQTSDTQQKSHDIALQEEAFYSFDLTKELPIRVKFLRDENNQQILSFLVYHSAMDEWSTTILMEDLFFAYNSRLNNQQPKWEAPAKQFHEYASEQHANNVLEKGLPFWVNHLGKLAPSTPLFSDTLVELDPTGSSVEFLLNRHQVNGLNSLARKNKASLFHVSYAAIALAMYFLGAGKKVLIGTSTSGRQDVNYLETIGFFTNVIMQHTKFDEQMTDSELVSQVRNNIIESLPYSDIPFGIVDATVKTDAEWQDNLCEFYIQLHAKNVLNGEYHLSDDKRLGYEMIDAERNLAKFGLHFELYEEPLSEDGALRVVINYRLNHYNAEQIQLIQQTTEHVMKMLSEANQDERTLMQLRRQLAGLTRVVA